MKAKAKAKPQFSRSELCLIHSALLRAADWQVTNWEELEDPAGFKKNLVKQYLRIQRKVLRMVTEQRKG